MRAIDEAEHIANGLASPFMNDEQRLGLIRQIRARAGDNAELLKACDYAIDTGIVSQHVITWIRHNYGKLDVAFTKEKTRTKANQKIAKNRKPRLQIDEAKILEAVGRGTGNYENIGIDHKCSKSTISAIVAKHGGKAALRKEWIERKKAVK
jgi:hypothetical protein